MTFALLNPLRLLTVRARLRDGQAIHSSAVQNDRPLIALTPSRRPPASLAGHPGGVRTQKVRGGRGHLVGRQERLSGCRSAAASRLASLPSKEAARLVSVNVGATAFTRMSGAHSEANVRVNPSTAPLEAAMLAW